MLTGKFCQSCGQAAKTHKRITLGVILHELPHQLFHLDHALPHTIIALLTRPGHAIREYLAGKRVKMYSPFTLLFMVSGLLGLALLAMKGYRIAPPVSSDDLAPRINEAIFKYQQWIRLALLPLIAIGPTLVLRKRTGYGFGEQIVAAAMLTSGSAMVSLLFIPFEWLAYRFHSDTLGARTMGASQAATTLYAIWTYAQLQNDGTRKDTVLRCLRSIGSIAAALFVFLLVMIVAGIGIVLARGLKH